MIKNFFVTEWAKLREMNFTQKRQYIWEYYRLQMFIFVFVAALVVYGINTLVINPRKSEYLYVAWLGDVVAREQLLELGEGLSEIVSDPDREAVFVVSYAATGNHQVDRHTHTRFMANLQLGTIDIFLTSRMGIEELEYVNFLRPITGVLAYTSVAHERVVYGAEGYAIAISLAGSRLLYDVGIDADNLYLAVVTTSGRERAVAQALEVLLR